MAFSSSLFFFWENVAKPRLSYCSKAAVKYWADCNLFKVGLPKCLFACVSNRGDLECSGQAQGYASSSLLMVCSACRGN